MEIPFACSRLREPFVDDLESLDRDLIGGGIEAGARPFRCPAVNKVPTDLLFAGFIHEDNRAILALGLPVDSGLPPLPQRVVVGDTPLQGYVGVLVKTSELARDVSLLVAFAIIDHVRASVQPGTLAKSVASNPIDL